MSQPTDDQRSAGWQLTTLAGRAGRLVGALTAAVGARPSVGRRGSHRPAGLRGDPVAAAAGQRLLELGAADRARFAALVDAHPSAATVLERVLATTGHVDAVASLARVWGELGVGERAAVTDPVRSLARAGRQTDRTTCGSASLTMLAASGDPMLALWLATGRLPAAGRPPELAGASERALAALADQPAERRFAAVQRVVKRRSTAGAVLGLPWPGALGTPPWGAARQARFAGVRWTQTMIDDSDRGNLTQALDLVRSAVRHEVPVPLYTGGDTSRGLATAVPRHVVLAVAAPGDDLVVWEPSVGRRFTLAAADLGGGPGRSLPALGGWGHLVWAVLPRS